MLKAKHINNYRKALTKDECCATYSQFAPEVEIYRLGGELKGTEPRCQKFGLDMSIRYRVRPDHICTAWKRRAA